MSETMTKAKEGLGVAAGSAWLLNVHQICEDKWQPMVAVEHQIIGFGPLCETEAEGGWWCDQFYAALSRAGARFRNVPAEFVPPGVEQCENPESSRFLPPVASQPNASMEQPRAEKDV